MTIHSTSITFRDCRIYLEPIGPEPADVGQRGRYNAEYVANTEPILASAIRQWVVGSSEIPQKAKTFTKEAQEPPLLTELLEILQTVVGDHGNGEGAADCARRIIKERNNARDAVNGIAAMAAANGKSCLQLREAIQRIIDMPPVVCGQYSYLPYVNGQNRQQERIQAELRKALG